ncbi:MAG TPA: alpha-L-arabinofuranosidase C-terminal domain-containing protein, partial [Candidatus Binatia bacterium]|nr:alpha-L-arabinofuranosidase C-terminal domain-containing protein [Candidatus Binatia bacterium]
LKTGRVEPTARARFVITLDQPGTVWLGFVSLFPPTWDNQPNGFRPDLMRMLVDLNPKFLRFPGGNYVEGDTVGERFDWKKTIGPVEDRHGHQCPWGYRSTDGMGLLEFLKWCEDMKAEPVLAVYAGYSLRGDHINPGSDLEPFVQDALDEIEYVTGDTNTTWGARRAQDGHPAPFKLTYIEIGNEDWFDKSGSYDGRFAQFYDAIKAKYPRLKLISTIGNDQPETSHVHSRQPDMLDEHYYRSVGEFIRMSPDYAKKYDRNGPEIFVGEWAAYETSFPPWDKLSREEPPTPDLKAAIGDAVFMAAMERNSDLIKMQCYAPLLVNVNPGGRQWRPDLIGYDALSSYGSPSYYAFQMFSRNLGDEILPAETADSSTQVASTRDSNTGEIYLKLVNPQS